jgi:hypothetical protein
LPRVSYQVLAVPERLPVYTKELLLAKVLGADFK